MSVRHAMMQTLLSRQASIVFSAVSLVVMARLFSPEEFGVFAVAASIYALLTTLAGFSLKWRLVRAPIVDPDEVASAFGLALTLHTLSALGLLAALPLLPDSVGPDLRGTLLCLAAALMAGPFLIPLEATLERRMRFGLLSLLAAARVALGAAVAIGLALGGLGATALAAGLMTERLVTLVGLLLWGPSKALVPPRLGGWRRFATFGTNVTLTQLIPRIGTAILMAAFAGLGGAAAAGLFNRAERVVKLFDENVLDGIQPVVLPAFTQALKNGVPPGELYIRKVEHLAGLTWPAFATIGVLAGPLVAVLLGSDWDAVVPITQVLVLIGIAKPFTAMSLKFFVALDRSAEILRIHAVHQVLRLALAIAGATVSLELACLGIALAMCGKGAMIGRAVKRATNYDGKALLRVLLRAACVTAGTVSGPILLLLWMPELSKILQLAGGLGLAGLGWVAALTLVRHPILPEILLALGLRGPAERLGSAAG